MYAGHLDLSVPLAWTVDDALDLATCARYAARMLAAADAEVAPVITEHAVSIGLAVRSNTHVMRDDAAEAAALLACVAATVPAQLGGRSLVGANPRLRLYRYRPGERHGAHWDTVVELDGGVQSMLTLVFYLNDDFTGGAIDFPELGRRIEPRRGRALVFQHRVLHEATEVTAGDKLVLRTDVLYR